MAAPKCKECEFRKCEGKTFVTAGYPVCRKKLNRLLLIERYSDTSPEWCPKRKAADAT